MALCTEFQVNIFEVDGGLPFEGENGHVHPFLTLPHFCLIAVSVKEELFYFYKVSCALLKMTLKRAMHHTKLISS